MSSEQEAGEPDCPVTPCCGKNPCAYTEQAALEAITTANLEDHHSFDATDTPESCDHGAPVEPCKSCDHTTCIDCRDLSGDCLACQIYYATGH